MRSWKIHLIFFLFVALAGVTVWKLYSLQIKQGDYYEALALGQQISFDEVKGTRGSIFLEDGNKLLAKNKKKYVVYIFPDKLLQPDTQSSTESSVPLELDSDNSGDLPVKELAGEEWTNRINILAKILEEEKEKLISALQGREVLKKEISEEKAQKISQASLPGVLLDEVLARFYPQKELLAHVLGFSNEEGEGQYGIEGYYNDFLKGEQGFREKGKSPFGYLASFLGSQEEFSQGGGTVYLALDYNIQYFSEKLLKEAKEQWDIDGGQIIVTEPSSGRVLAMAQLPTFDPNEYSAQDKLEIFLNSSTQKLFEPGSVFKPITMAAALEQGLVTPETEYEDKGIVEVGGPPIYNFQKRVWGKQKMTDVLEESINTGAIFVEQKLGNELFLYYLKKFGLFEKTGIDLQSEVFSANETLKNGYPRDFATASFGQGVELTPIQLVRAFGALANGGELKQPYVVEKIINPDGKEVVTQSQIQKEVISETTAAKITAMLVSVVEQGSGRRAKIPGYYVAGKTGTAQVPLPGGGYFEEKTIQSFMGYFPALNPQVLIFVKLDNPKGAKTAEYSAVPLFKELAKHIIDLWQIPPSYE